MNKRIVLVTCTKEIKIRTQHEIRITRNDDFDVHFHQPKLLAELALTHLFLT